MRCCRASSTPPRASGSRRARPDRPSTRFSTPTSERTSRMAPAATRHSATWREQGSDERASTGEYHRSETTAVDHGGACALISGENAAKSRTFHVTIVDAPAFMADTAMSASYIWPPITSPPLRLVQRIPGFACREMHDRPAAPVRFQEDDRVCGPQSVRRGQSCQDRIGLRQ